MQRSITLTDDMKLQLMRKKEFLMNGQLNMKQTAPNFVAVTK